jgi:hypothetical protein
MVHKKLEYKFSTSFTQVLFNVTEEYVPFHNLCLLGLTLTQLRDQ